MLEGFEASRRDKIAAILRSEQAGSSLRRADRDRARPGTEPEERGTIQVVVCVVEERPSALLRLDVGLGDPVRSLLRKEGEEEAVSQEGDRRGDMEGERLKLIQEMVGGGRNILHVAAAALSSGGGDLVPRCLQGLRIKKEEGGAPKKDLKMAHEACNLLVARDSGGRTPFFLALEKGNLQAALSILEEVSHRHRP